MMQRDTAEDVVLVARVRLSLADGSEEEWLAPLRLTDDALSYRAEVYPPEGAVVIRVDPLKRSRASMQEVVVARADVTTL